jgi:predicted phosphodiesterase
MRCAVLADIHDNLPALQAVLADLQSFQPEIVLVAGDMLLGGPYPAEVMAELRALPAVVIRGNNEGYLLEYSQAPQKFAEKRWAALRWSYAHLGSDNLAWIARLPEQTTFTPPGVTPVRMLHGSPHRTNQGLVPDDEKVLELFRTARLVPPDNSPAPLSEALALVSEPTLVCAHTHIPWQQCVDGRLVFNPGSVGASIDGDRRAHYARLEWQDSDWQVELCTVEYDYRALLDGYTQNNLLVQGGAFSRACLLNSLTGVNYAWFFVQHAAALAQQAGLPADCIPDDIWDQAERTFDWVEAKELV